MDEYIALKVPDSRGYWDQETIEAKVAFVDDGSNTVFVFADSIKKVGQQCDRVRTGINGR